FGPGNERGGGPGNNGFGNNNGFGPGNERGGGPGNNGFGNNNGFGPGNERENGRGNERWGPSRNIVAVPSIIAAGGRLTVTVDDCRNGGTMTSPGFRRATLSRVPGDNDRASGTVTVAPDAHPGTYDIRVDCVGASRLTRPSAFTVIGGAHAGFGGGSSTGATPTDMAIGSGLVAAAVIGGGVYWMRRRSEKRI
ncbi:hypothetical protein, partial [Streptomyces sp. NPDC058272]|uniref:hypothetical protein n=1 Tax=Streptomyces sp. NPDC058272 TaxID=3346415 RepID=UPI0036EE5D74